MDIGCSSLCLYSASESVVSMEVSCAHAVRTVGLKCLERAMCGGSGARVTRYRCDTLLRGIGTLLPCRKRIRSFKNCTAWPVRVLVEG